MREGKRGLSAMAADFSERERAFIDGLKPETGDDLGGWMAAIARSGFSHRNDVIDWLRQQGFTFAHASWLERIHHNGGRLIYGEAAAQPASPKPAPVPAGKLARANSAVRTAGTEAEIDGLLAAAKAYRPLAQLVLREVLAVVPGADVSARAGHIALEHGRPFAAIAATARDVRLLLALGASAGPGWEKPKLTGAALHCFSGLTHMKVMTDAREVNADLKAQVLISAQMCRS